MRTAAEPEDGRRETEHPRVGGAIVRADPTLPARVSPPILGRDGRPDLEATRQTFEALIAAGRYAEADRLMWWLWTKGDEHADQGEAFQFSLVPQWTALAEAYHPAWRSLRMARDRSLVAYERGDAFAVIEVIWLNQGLGQNDRTVALVKERMDADPKSGRSLVGVALHVLAQEEAHQLIADAYPDWRSVRRTVRRNLVMHRASDDVPGAPGDAAMARMPADWIATSYRAVGREADADRLDAAVDALVGTEATGED